ncbi:hypothetical protein EB001_07815 [bacterium]|nr:hypothetical protein [bacterium]
MFEIDLVIYILYLILTVPQIKPASIEELSWEGWVLSIFFILFIFTMIIYLSKLFPLVMFFFLLFALLSEILNKKIK